MSLMDRIERTRRRLEALPVTEPPAPWRRTLAVGVGGLTEIGFGEAPDRDLLLVVSSMGRGVFDCVTGERVARDRAEPDDAWYDETCLRAAGLGPLEGATIRLAGLHGGGLPSTSGMGWGAWAEYLNWPVCDLLLTRDWDWIWDESAQVTKVGQESEFRAFGFSYTGRTLVIATSSDVRAYHHPASP